MVAVGGSDERLDLISDANFRHHPSSLSSCESADQYAATT
jgi:hypothetical protein